jgi:simple sugar transport system substrate-binding protein
VKAGCKAIFTTSFGYMDSTVEAAKKYPDVVFAHATGFKRAPNLATYMADFYQVYYLNGLMAGALTKSGKVGYVGGFPIPELKRHISAFALGVAAAHPGAVVDVKWINSWFSPQKAREASEALIVEGNDVLAFTEDSATVVQVAAKHKLPSFSHYSPMYRFAPDFVVSGELVHWEKIYIDFLSKVHDGTYAAGKMKDVDYWWLLREGAVEMAAQPGMPVNPKYVDALKQAKMTVSGKEVSVYDRVMELWKDMSSPSPKFDPFTGPIKDRNGVERVPAGKRMTVEELTSMQWMAPGVVGPVADEPK